MSARWDSPVGMRMAPGQREGHVQPVCDRCLFVGASTWDWERARAEADAHGCDLEAVEREALRWEVQRRPVVAVPTEGGWAMTNEGTGAGAFR